MVNPPKRRDLEVPNALRHDAVTWITLKTETPISIKSTRNSHKYGFARTFYRNSL